jgi:quercetin dioxygenase-like cupin family protein
MGNAQAAPETNGVTVELLAALDLAPEIEGMAGRQLRMRMVTIEPGGVFGPIHDHIDRPGMVYILQGTITDYRDGVATEYGPGVGWPEDKNTTHWLENRGNDIGGGDLGRHSQGKLKALPVWAGQRIAGAAPALVSGCLACYERARQSGTSWEEAELVNTALGASRLPQLHGRPMVTDGGIETDLIFHHDVDRPHFAAFPLLESAEGRALLEDYYNGHAAIARRAGVPSSSGAAARRRSGGVRDPAGSVIMPVRYRGPAVLPACDSPGSRSARSRCAWTATRRSAYIKTGRTAALAKGSAAALACSARVNR